MPEEESDRPVPLEYASRQSRGSSNTARRIAWILMAASGVGLLLFLLMPFNRSRDRDGYSRPKCASNLHQIELGILLYANENGGSYPDSLQTVATEQLWASTFVCPSSNDAPSTAPTTQGQIDDMAVPGHVSYIYIGAGLTSATVLPNQVIVYEPLANHAGDGMNVLLGDGHTEWVDKTRALKILAAVKSTTQPVTLPP